MNPQYLHQQVGDQSQGFGPSKPGMLPPGPQGSFGMNSGLPPPQSGFMQPPTTMAYNGPMGSPLAQNNMKPVPLNPMQSGPPQMGPPPNQMQPGPPHLGPPPNQMQPGPPQMTGPPPNQMQPGPPQMGPPPNQMQPGPPQMTGPPPNQMQPGPPQMTGPPSNQMQPGPPSHMGPPTNQMPGPPQPRQQQQPGPPSNQPGPPGTQPSQLGPPMGQGSPAGPFGSPMAGKLGQTNQFGSQSGQPGPMGPPPMNQGSPMNQPGPPGSQMKNGPSLGQMGMPPPPNLQICPPKPQPNQMPFGVNPPPFQPNPMAPPTLGPGSPMNQSNQLPQPGPPPLPGGPPRGNMAPGQYSNKGAPSPYQNMAPPPVGPPGPMNYPPGPNQLANQMSDMHIGGAGPPGYGGPMKPQLNGENSPHMPPPLGQNQGQYMNGAQNRGPQQPMGYPPMPGQQPQQQQMPGGPYPTQQNYQQNQQQARRLDPDQMPSPIQVTLDDQRTRSGVFSTNQKGLAPPLVSTNFITQDQGNAGPRYIRSTMYSVPTTSDMMKQTAVPFGIVISPLARIQEQEYPPPIVDFGALGPVRCIRCKAYMSPFMQFIDSGKRFQCSFCKATTEVPAEYFQHLDHTGQRVDRYDRPELILGTYEFVATQEYCRNNTFPKAPAIIFVIDVSYNNIKSGLVHLLCAEMKEILNHLPVDQGQEKTKMKVGFITYNSTVHFYNIKGNLAQPQMMVVGDVQEIFMPLLDGFLCDVEDSAAVIDSLMVQIPAMFGETRETETVLLPAIQAGLEALKASECAGKLIVFHSTLPTADAPGRLKNRDERKLLGTEKERTVLVPQTQAYNTLGQDCVQAGCSVDLFITNNSYIDIATIGQICRLTGGEIFKYTYFQANIDGPRLVNDVITDISRPVAFDSIMRVRTSTGVRPTEFFGHFYMSNTTDMEIPAIDCDKAIAIEIKHDDKLTEEEGVYIQVALLYTSCSGQRRLRILNLSLKTCSQMSDLYRSCELDTIVNFFAKQSVYRLLENNPKSVKDSLVNRCAQMLACYRKNCASPSSAGQLILPECMKLLPLYVNCLMKSDAISGGSDMTLDDRSFVMQCVTTMDIPTSVAYFYPRLIPLHEIQNGTETPEIPSSIRCTVEKMADNGVYLLENGIHMLLWIGLNANSSWIQSVFGVSNAAQIDVDQLGLPELDNCLSQAVRNLIDQVRIQRHRCMRLTLVRQRDKLETVFRHFLVEDRGNDGSSSYVDFLCHMHKEIRQLLS